MQHHEREAAHSRFQEIAFAYAILSDERRRKRYDTTGNTSESLELEVDGFNWFDWYKTLWADMVTGRKISDFETSYKHSEEERQGILIAYKISQGDLDKIFNSVMLSNPLEDEDRFRKILNDAIAAGEVEAYRAFTHEKEDKRRRRHKRACGEGREAEEYAKKLGVWDDLFGNAKTKSKSKSKEPDAALMDMIQNRKKGASTQFLDNLEAKYGGQQQKDKKRKFEEPPEELFQRNRPKPQKVRKEKPESEAEAEDEEEEEEQEQEQDVDLEVDSSDWGSEDEEEKDTIKPPKANMNNGNGPRTRKKANAKKITNVQDHKVNKSAKPNGDGVKGNPKKKKKKKGAASATKVDIEEQTSSTKKGRSSRQARSTRI